MVEGGFGICGVFLAHNYVSEQFGNYVEYGMYKVLQQVWKLIYCKCVRVLASCHFGNVHTAWVTKTVVV